MGRQFRDAFGALTTDPEREGLDVLRFTDGRVFEQFVAPHRVGSAIIGRVVSFRDIGASTRAAEAVERNRALLEKAQEVAHIGSWVAELDATARLSWSTELHRIFDVPIGQFGGTFEAFVALIHEDDRAAVRAATAAAIDGGSRYDVEHRVKIGDGSIRWVHEKGRRHPGRRRPPTADDRHRAGHHRAPPARGSAPAVAEDGGDRPARGRHRARPEQRADGDRRATPSWR